MYAAHAQIKSRWLPRLDLVSSNNAQQLSSNHHHHQQQLGMPHHHCHQHLPPPTTFAVTTHHHSQQTQWTPTMMKMASPPAAQQMMEHAGDDTATCHVVQAVMMHAIVTVCSMQLSYHILFPFFCSHQMQWPCRPLQHGNNTTSMQLWWQWQPA